MKRENRVVGNYPSSRETPGNKLPGAYATNVPPARLLYAAVCAICTKNALQFVKNDTLTTPEGFVILMNVNYGM